MTKLRSRGALRREAAGEGADFVSAADVDDRALEDRVYGEAEEQELGLGKAAASRPLPRPPASARPTRRFLSSSGRGSRKEKRDVQEPDPGRVPGPAATRLHHLRRALLPGPQLADLPGNKLGAG